MTDSPPPPHPSRKPARYSEIAYRAIKDAILTGRLEVEKPLIEEDLAGLLSISRTPVREALAILEHEGLIGPRHGRGLYVRPIEREEFLEIFAANELVEQELVRRAARLATDELLPVMAGQVSRETYYAVQGDLPACLDARREFMRLLGEAAANAPLAQFLVSSQERIDLYLLGPGKSAGRAMIAAAARQHEAILAALVRRDPDEAARLVIYHTQDLRERFAQLFRGEEPGEEGNFNSLADF
jgi:DNA-binding GntR family transcriptional regulator